MASYDGHASKRQRTEDGYGVQGKRVSGHLHRQSKAESVERPPRPKSSQQEKQLTKLEQNRLKFGDSQFDTDLRDKIRRKRVLLQRWTRTTGGRKTGLRTEYCKLRNQVRKLTRQEKKRKEEENEAKTKEKNDGNTDKEKLSGATSTEDMQQCMISDALAEGSRINVKPYDGHLFPIQSDSTPFNPEDKVDEANLREHDSVDAQYAAEYEQFVIMQYARAVQSLEARPPQAQPQAPEVSHLGHGAHHSFEYESVEDFHDIDERGFDLSSVFYDSFEDPHKPSPSPVVHVRGLSDNASEPDLMNALSNFGRIGRQALVEFEEINSAVNLVQYAESAPVYVAGRVAHFNYSTSQKISRPPGQEENPNKILLFTIYNPKYPITVDVMHTICSNSGSVARIVIFRKNGLQAMVEFDSLDGAQRAKQALNGADIYSGCCTLKVEYAKPTRLNVTRNDSEMWDYTHSAGKGDYNGKSAPLLQEPRYGSAPTPYGSNDGPPRRSLQPPPPSQGSMEYGGPSDFDNYGRNDRYQDAYSPPRGHHDGYGPPRSHDPYGPPPGNFSDAGSQPGGPGSLYQQGSVLMVYGLESMNCQKVFNIFCLYGNVVRIKFLKTKEGTAMVQMGDPASCERAIKNLTNCFFFGHKLQLAFSKQVYLQDVHSPHELPDGSPSFVDFMGSRNNRFTNPDAAAKNRINPPYKCLHYFNAPVNMDEKQIHQVFLDSNAKTPAKIKIFPSKSEKSSTGLLEWDSKSDAVEALVLCNHTPVDNPSGKNPYIFKMCFSGSPILERNERQ